MNFPLHWISSLYLRPDEPINFLQEIDGAQEIDVAVSKQKTEKPISRKIVSRRLNKEKIVACDTFPFFPAMG